MSENETYIQAVLREFLNRELKGSNLYRDYTEMSCKDLIRYITCCDRYISNNDSLTKRRKKKTKHEIDIPKYKTRNVTKQLSK